MEGKGRSNGECVPRIRLGSFKNQEASAGRGALLPDHESRHGLSEAGDQKGILRCISQAETTVIKTLADYAFIWVGYDE